MADRSRGAGRQLRGRSSRNSPRRFRNVCSYQHTGEASVEAAPGSTARPLRATLRAMPDAPRIPCPCCGHATLSERGSYEICPVCFWEDDGDEDVAHGGPNGVPLGVARRNFLALGAAEPKDLAHVRPPAADEPRVRVFVLTGDRVEERHQG